MKSWTRYWLFSTIAFFGVFMGFGQSNKAKFNPDYHYYPSGDPTGTFYFNGYYYNNWGVAKSKDFVHWELTEYGKRKKQIIEAIRDASLSSIKRDSLRNSLTRLGGSGTIVYDKFNASGLGTLKTPPLISFWHNDTEPWGIQTIGLAFSIDSAKTWKRYDKNPILDVNSREFRDPKVFWHEPTKKWIMAIGWADVPKVQFYNSSNLIDWELSGEFGPLGAVEGVWECADLFPIKVDGDPNNIKWVLSISVQPLSGQYFIGDFDGKKFTVDPEFAIDLEKENYKPSGKLLFGFENGHHEWDEEGEAFKQSPSNQALFRQGAVMGKEGEFFANSHYNRTKSIGKITSPSFQIAKDYINFLVGGNHIINDLSVNLLVNNKVVRSQSGNNSGGLQWVGWDVSEFKTHNAKIEIIDNSRNGAILADHFMLCDELTEVAQREKAFWVDYGPDFFAVRAWNNYANDEERVVWTGWMGSWRYGGTEPVRGIQSVPRKVELKTFPEGVRLIQNPIKELEELRQKHVKASKSDFEGLWKPKKIQPKKNAYELIVEFENVNAHEFGVKIGVGNNQQTVIGYKSQDEKLFVDRRDSGLDDFISLFPQINDAPLKNRSNQLKLRIFVDSCSVEVFANDGETVVSSKIYPDPSCLGIELFSNLGKVKVKNIELWELSKINN